MKRLALILALITATSEASESVTPRAGVATSSRYATQAAVAALRNGGSAMDAATAAAFAMAVVRPDAAGIGGGGFLIYYQKRENATWAVDFRETAPWTPVEKKADDDDQAPLSASTRAGTPGFVAGLVEAQQRFGRSKWKDLLRPAVFLAKEGFDVDSQLTTALTDVTEANLLDPTARETLLRGGGRGIAPTRIVQPDLAETLSRLAKSKDDFYGGATSEKIIALMEQSGGRLTIRDLREYHAIWRAPLQIDLGAYSIQTAPPPSRGGAAIASMLAILGAYDLGKADLGAPGPSHLLAEADRRATYDARRVVADPTYSRIDIASILSAKRAGFWRSTIDPDKATSTPLISDLSTAPSNHTTHISVVDAEGNIASLTISLSGSFGSGVMVPGAGFLLNAALDDFSGDPASSHPNAEEPRKRPATPIAPLIMFREGQPFLAAGSSGGDAIPSCLTRLLLEITKKGASLRDAIDAPRLHQPDYPDRVEFESSLGETARRLGAMGHSTKQFDSIGEINAVMIDGDRIISVSDPRGKGSTGGF